MAMKKLAADIRSLLSSSLQINSFKRVVEELVYNSLDAKATSIAVRIDLEENKIQVVDNGCGITENDFDIIGQNYCTSKCVHLNTLKSVPNFYGFRGQFLANLINIARKVKITSRFGNVEDTWVKIFYDGKERDLAKTTTRPSVGTTVEVSGLFYNLHIQSKNVEALNELNEIKILLKQLSLIHSNISISLRDDSKNEIVFKAHKNRNVYQTFGMLFNIDEKDIQEFKVEKKEYKVTAYFARKGKEIGQYHWIYLNGKFINNYKMHKIVNDALSKSLKPFLKRKIKTKVDDNEDVLTKRNLPFYIILLSCPYYDYDIIDLSKHTTLEFRNWQNITNLLNKLIQFYTGEEKLNKQLKCEENTRNDLKPKISHDDMRDQVRKIVEELLKSNSKKLGVSQMQNGVKGKLTKRKKTIKDNSLKLSLSKVIPSKNKLVRQLSKDVPKKSEVNDEVTSNSTSEVIPAKNLTNENDPIKVIQNHDKKQKTISQSSSDIKERQKGKKKKINLKYKNIISNYSDQSSDISIIKKKDNIKINKNITEINNDVHNYKEKHEDDKSNVGHDINSDFVKSTDVRKFNNKYNADVFRCSTRKQHIEEDMYHHFYEKENLLKENDITTICNFTNSNTKITLHKKVEEIIVYDYIPHPLNSNKCDDLHDKRPKKKSNISSRDLVKTILSTQNNISTHEHIEPSGNNKYQLKRSQTFPNKYILAASQEGKPDEGNTAKYTRASTFDVWNSYYRPKPHFTNKQSDKGMLLTKMTYESHHYNQNIYSDDNFKTGIKRATQFITKQSKDNFLLSIKKQKNHFHKNNFCFDKRKHLNKPKGTKNNKTNLSLGIRNFFKTNNLMPGSLFTIEFSHSKDNNILRETNHQQANESTRHENNNFIYTNFDKWTVNATINENLIDKTSTSFYNKNTYTITETDSEARYDCQNYESIKDTNNYMHGTYTIETNNGEWSNNYINDEECSKEKTSINQNIIFISEPHIEVAESSSDKIIDPINICETVFDNSHSFSSAPFESLTYMENVVNEINRDIVELTEKQKSSNILSQEVSHHFNASTSNTNNLPTANKSPISNRDFNIQNNHTSNVINKIVCEDILKETTDLTHSNLPKYSTDNNYSIKNRPRFMPKGMSQIFENCNTKGVCDYNHNEEYFEYNIYEDFTNKVEINTEIFKPRIQNATEETTKAIERVHTKLHKENSSLIFDGELLKHAQVLGQVDDKFIAAIIKAKSDTSDFLVLFDQHAVHERIRLEKNMTEYFNQQEWNKVKLDDFLIKLSKDEILFLHNYKEKFAQLGLEWNILSDHEVSFIGIPEAILGKNPRQVDKVITAVKNLVLEEIDTIKSQGGCISLHPKSIMDLVFSEACRYAIKFGDKLTITDCKELIQSLSECKTPFQCAHGRPVMAVLLEMLSHDARDYKTDVSKIHMFSVNNPKQLMNIHK